VPRVTSIYWGSKGRRTGGLGGGYYSFDLVAWHLISINTSDGDNEVPYGFGPLCADGSPQRLAPSTTLPQCLRPIASSPTGIPLFNSGVANSNNDTTR
jgi:hypothetical protein